MVPGRTLYRALEDERYSHDNTSFNIVHESRTGADTNTTESRWHQVKATLNPYNRKCGHMQHLADYMFRRKCKDEGVDTFCKCMLLISIDSSSSQDVEEEVE